MHYSVTTAATEAPISVADLKRHLVVEHSFDDLIIEGVLSAAVAMTETYLRRPLITRQIRAIYDGFCLRLTLPTAPVQDVVSVSYINNAGAWTTLASDQYRLIDSLSPPQLEPAYGATWPVPRPIAANVQVDLQVGYGSAGASVPADILAAVRLIAGHLYENREASVAGMSISELPIGPKALLDPHRLWI